MANFVFADRVKDSSSSYSSSSFTLSGTAPSGFQSFNAGIGDGNYCFYCVTDASGNWEVNYGAYTNSSTALARNSTPVASSNSGSAVTFSGSVTIFCDNPAKFIGAQENWGIKSGRVYINAGWSSNDD